MDIFNEQKKIYDYINETIKKNKKISHAYLIETNNYNDYMTLVNYLMKVILCYNSNDNSYIKKVEKEINNKSYPDIKYIYPDGNYIKKEQLLLLEKEFSKKSMLDNKLIYVIDGADKLNDSAANTILKFLEEPEKDIVAILITSNRYNVLETILSRCQVITMLNNRFDIELNEYLIKFIEDLVITKKMVLNYDLYLENLFYDKKIANNTLSNLELIFYNYLNGYSLSSELRNLLNKCDNDIIIKWTLLIDKSKQDIEYNVNMKLWLLNLISILMEV